MKVLVVNAGSSSMKYQLFDMQNEQVIAKGNCERIGSPDSFIGHKAADGREFKETIPMPTHSDAFERIVFALTKSDAAVIENMNEIKAVGHRIVQGGAIFKESCLVTEKVIEDIESLIPLAPLHNAAHVQGIRACIKALGHDVPQVVVFDTSFHSTMPPKAYIFGVPYEYYEKYGVRRYGFHGTSHRYVSDRVAELEGKDKKDLKIVTCHLGNGSSIAAICDGKCIDTSMGLTPLDGIIMGTRSGTLDPSVVTFIQEKEGLSAPEMAQYLNKKCGVLGISGVSNDNRDVTEAAQQGHERAQLSLDILHYQIAKYIGGYAAAMHGLDAVVFTGGIGENNYITRELVCEYLDFLGVEIDKEYNMAHNKIKGHDIKISTPASKVAVYAISTNEELVIARDTVKLVGGIK